MFDSHRALWRSKCPKKKSHRTDGKSHVTWTLRFPLGGFPAFPRAKLEVGDPYYRFLDYLEVVPRVYGRLLSDGMPRNATELSEAVIRSSDHSGPNSGAAGPGDR